MTFNIDLITLCIWLRIEYFFLARLDYQLIYPVYAKKYLYSDTDLYISIQDQ